MKIVNIIGGLGNQMLQYAYAVVLKAQHPEEDVYVDTSHFNGYNLHNGYEIERIFGQKLPTAKWWHIMRVSWYMPWYKPSRLLRRLLPVRKTECLEIKYFVYSDIFADWKGNGYFEGYWHYPELQRPYMNKIREAFTFPSFNDNKNIEIANQMSNGESVAVHVRRGDYVGALSFKDICTTQYYQDAIKKAISLCRTPIFFIFSNDMPYCEELFSNYKEKYEIHFVDFNTGKNSFRDMQLMTLAKINIIANSSFSWWGGWLNQRKDHYVLCPPRWVNFTDSLDMIPKEWIRII